MKQKVLAGPYLVWMVIFIVAPLFFVFYYAFTDSNGNFTFANISELGDYLPTFLDSIWLAAFAALVCLILAYPIAYFISKMPLVKQRIVILLIMLPMCMSFLLRTLAWVSILSDTGLINTFLGKLGIGPLKLIRTNAAIIFGMVYNYLPYMIMPLYSIMLKIDDKVIEAGKDLGANAFQRFTRIILPLSVPGIVSGVTMVFVPAVSTFYISVKMGPSDTAMIGDLIEKQFKNAYNPNLGAAMSLVLMIMIFISMAVMNRFSDVSDGGAS